MTAAREERIRIALQRGGPYPGWMLEECLDEIERLKQVEKDAAKVLVKLSKQGRK